MPTKTDRILSYLPGTFLAKAGGPLYTLVNAFGTELLQAENSLAAIMQAHWVDHANRGTGVINDLAQLAALYGLAPRCPEEAKCAEPAPLCALPVRCDESLEEFREHLKRYVRTFIEGTTTIQGMMRITAEILGLHIADSDEAIEGWWDRRPDSLVTTHRRSDDVAELLFGQPPIIAQGSPAWSAQIRGTVDLSQGLDLQHTQTLRLQLDDRDPVAIDLVAGAPNPNKITLDWLVITINVALGAQVARHDGHYLTLTSPTVGAQSQLTLLEGSADAAEAILGVAPHIYHGQSAQQAQVTGLVDLNAGVNLTTERYLRLTIDGATEAEIDCAGPNPLLTTLDDIVTAINEAFKEAFAEPIASHDDHHIILTSPTIGFGSSIAFGRPAAQNAFNRLFGPVDTFHLGQDAQPARLTGQRDLSGGADLSERVYLRLSLDDGGPVDINCAGLDPANTRPAEIATAINNAFPGDQVIAAHNGRFITLSSRTVGPDGQITIGTPASGDATELILGIGPCTFTGAEPRAAHLRSTGYLSGGLNIHARHHLLLAVDDDPPVEIDLRRGVENRGAATGAELRDVINEVLGQDIAALEGDELVLTAPRQLRIDPLTAIQQRRFVNRAMVTDEAAQAIFGFISQTAQGAPATAAQVRGTADLSRGLDLTQARFLRLKVDDRPAIEIDCAGIRPRATLSQEIVEKINRAVGLPPVVRLDGKYLTLTSPTVGANSLLAFEPSQATDARTRLLGVEAGLTRGQDGARVRFTSTVDLSQGIDLPRGAAVQISLDRASPVQITLVEREGDVGIETDALIHKTVRQIAVMINTALDGNQVTDDGRHLIITSAKTGLQSQLRFEPAGDDDVTREIFGVAAPRIYRGAAAQPARIVGTPNLSAGVDLRLARFLSLGFDDEGPVLVDCAAKVTNAALVQLDNIRDAINDQFTGSPASHDGVHLILTSPTAGLSSRITIQAHTAEGIESKLFGSLEEREFRGQDPQAAMITGQVDLLSPVNLADRALLRLAVDDQLYVDLDVAGAVPSQTSLDEIMAAINDVFPDMASATDDDRLRLTAPTVGADSRLALLPPRYIEVIEYPARPARYPEPTVEDPDPSLPVRHGDRRHVENKGVTEAEATIQLTAGRGVFGPALVNETMGWQIRLLARLRPQVGLRLWLDPLLGLQAAKIAAGQATPILPEEILVSRWPDQNWQPLASLPESQRMQAEAVLKLPEGRSNWRYLDCHSDRFNESHFDAAHFAGGQCREGAIFNFSRFATPSEPVAAAFAFGEAAYHAETTIQFHWSSHQAGAFSVNLPADLPLRFGGRFNQSRFGQADGAAELYERAVTEPPEDDLHLVTMIKRNKQSLVRAEVVDTVPLGWTAVQIPFRQAQYLTLGNDKQAARLYLSEAGAPGFIKIRARELGGWGNEIAVSARPAGPAMFNICLVYQGHPFEYARTLVKHGKIVAPDEAPTGLVLDLLKPQPIGILQAKAAGVQAEVTRTRAEET